MKRSYAIAFVVCAALVACDSKKSSDESAASATTAANETDTSSDSAEEEPSAEPESQAETSTATRWVHVESGELNGAQQAQLDRALGAQKELGTTLLKALTTSIGENGLAGSVTFCKEQAPKLADSVAESQAVEIGRTSTKLRNPENTGPAWVPNAMEQAEKSRAAFAGPNGELGMVAPISTAELCTNCHGVEDAIPTEVATAIDEAYPDDQARGFKEGDLRGWFWVEVPPPS